MNTEVTHPDRERLEAFGLGKLGVQDAEEVAGHLDGCTTCQSVVDTQPDDALVAVVRTIVCQPPSSSVAASWPLPELANHPRYRLQACLGAGGMGTVYRAEHRLMDRQVAIKVINRALMAKSGAIERFKREIKAAARLSHPNIVTVYDAEESGQLHFLVMELVEGTSLDHVVEEQGALPIQAACDYARQAALGLQHAFESGLVHRDLKPHNLMLTPKGTVKILDFGLASLGHEERSTEPLTLAGDGIGTPEYMAPEQIRDARTADIRADIYSLGCTLYFLLTGQPPIPEGPVLRKIVLQLEGIPTAVTELRTDVPAPLARIVERMMAKAPDLRFQTPQEVVEALLTLQGQETVTERRSRSLGSVWGLTPRGWMVRAAWLLGTVLGAAVIWVVGGQVLRFDPSGVPATNQASSAATLNGANREASPTPPAVGSERVVCLGEFDRNLDGWIYYGGWEFPGAQGSVLRNSADARFGEGCLKLRGDFSKGGSYVAAHKTLSPVALTELRLWVRSPEVNSVWLRVQDATGQWFQFNGIEIRTPDQWQQVVVKDFDKACDMTFGGANDRKFHQPATAIRICINGIKRTSSLLIDRVEGLGPRND